MRVLALEPYFAGSHQAFLTQWQAHGAHDWTLLTLPGWKWKWRMRHAAITFAEQVAEAVRSGATWDVLWCSDMLNLAEFVGLAPPAVQALPRVVYFHENQLTYPVRVEDERDYQYAFTNLTTALAADAVWFNSAFHRDAFLEAMESLLRRMPDFQPMGSVERVRAKSSVHPPGVHDAPARGPRPAGPLRVLWAARWEHDKNPALLFDALRRWRKRGGTFRLAVIGERFRESPAVFDEARDEFAECIDRWGYQQTRADYDAVLQWADVIVSTADHEFFGLSVVEAARAGAWPVVPRRLAYPEVLQLDDSPGSEAYFYDGSAGALADRLAELSVVLPAETIPAEQRDRPRQLTERYVWQRVGPAMDAALRALATGSAGESDKR